MKELDIVGGMFALLQAGLSVPIVVVNRKDNSDSNPLPSPPFVTFQVVKGERIARFLEGGGDVSTGYLQLNVVIAKGGSDKAAIEIVDLVNGIFEPKSSAQITGGTIEFLSISYGVGFPSDTHWIEPLRVNYRAIKET